MIDNQPPVEVPKYFLRKVNLKNIRVFEGLKIGTKMLACTRRYIQFA